MCRIFHGFRAQRDRQKKQNKSEQMAETGEAPRVGRKEILLGGHRLAA
jgi:hypothetical protein